jgi:hypothetical protein
VFNSCFAKNFFIFQKKNAFVTWFDRCFDHQWKIHVESKKLSLENIIHEGFDESKELCLYPIEISSKNVKIITVATYFGVDHVGTRLFK